MKNDAYNINCLEYMKTVESKHFDLTFCDSPFGIGESRKVVSRMRPVIQKNGKKTVIPPLHTIKTWDDNPPTQEVFDEIFRVSKKVCIFGENYLQFNQKPTSSGRIFWDKVNGKSNFSDGELIWTNLFSSIRQFTYMWNGFCQAESVERPLRQQGNKKLNEKRVHPSQKPIEIYSWILLNFVKPGIKVFDPFLGSGSSRIACHRLGCEFVGTEIDADYFEKQETRFNTESVKNTFLNKEILYGHN